MRNKTYNQSGSGLIEILISLLVVSLGLVMMHAAFNFLLLNKNSKDQELALRIASSKMEELRNTAYNSLPSSGSFTHTLLTELPAGQGTVTVTNYNSATKEIQVTVTWREPNAANDHRVNLVTLMTENGL